MFRRSFFLVVASAFAAGCSSGGGTTPAVSLPTQHVAAAQHLYVANTAAAGGVMRFTLPISSASTPDFTVPAPSSLALAVDSGGDLVTASLGGNIQVFPAPLSASSAPSASFNAPSGTPHGMAFSATGQLVASASGGSITAQMFTPPFTSGTVASATLTNLGATQSFGVAFDSSQNLYIASESASPFIVMYPPPYTINTATTTLQQANGNYRNIAISAHMLAAANADSPGGIDFYTLPLTPNQGPSFTITSGVSGPEAVAFDATGNLYVGNLSSASVSVYAPPFSASSAPVAQLHIPGFSIFSIAVGS